MHILLVEDNEVAAKSIELKLASEGHNNRQNFCSSSGRPRPGKAAAARLPCHAKGHGESARERVRG